LLLAPTLAFRLQAVQHMTDGSINPDQIIFRLNQSFWVISQILEPFREKLLRMLEASSASKDAPTWVLTVQYYRHLSLGSLPGPSPSGVIASLDPDTLRKVAKIIHPAASIPRPNDLWCASIDRSTQVITDAWPEAAGTLLDSIDESAPILCPGMRSASHPHLWGLLFLAPAQDEIALSVSLVHELAHQELFLLNLLDPLVQPESLTDSVYSPYQNKNRPSIGRLHSAHALFRMIEIERRLNLAVRAQHLEYLKATLKTLSDDLTTGFSRRLIHEVYWPAVNNSSDSMEHSSYV
jgi:HEXXH motif-containing protein